jgi:hypothetical protein
MQIKVLSQRLDILPMIDLMNKSRMTEFGTGKKGKECRGRSLKIALMWVMKHFFRAFCKQKWENSRGSLKKINNNFGVSNGTRAELSPVNA